MLGLKHAKPLSDKKILQYAKKYNIDRFNIYKLDTAFGVHLSSLESMQHDSEAAYNLGQPQQYLLFDKKGKLLSFNVSVHMDHAHGSINWNTGNCFNTFPPKSYATISTNINFSSLRPFFIPISEPKDNKGTMYDCVIIWNHYMGKQSEDLIKTALKNLQEYTSDRTVALYFVNDDSYFAK